MFRLTLETPTKDEVIWSYDPRTSTFVDEARQERVFFGRHDDTPVAYHVAHQIAPDNPAGKKRNPKSVKIQMGFSCNFSCAYCNQAEHSHYVGGGTAKAQAFLENVSKWYDGGEDGTGTGTQFEFWGGEPFLYFVHMKALHEGLAGAYPNARFQVITNGSFFDDPEKVDWIIDNSINVAVSHDGPGQHLREGKEYDILDNPDIVANLQRLLGVGSLGFNSVLTNGNMSLASIRQHIEGKLGARPNQISHGTEEILLPYDAYAMMVTPQNAEDHKVALHTLFFEAASGATFPHNNSIRNKIDDFMLSVDKQRPVEALGQKCGMDREDSIAIDLEGNVTTCHNTAADSKHLLGNIEDLGSVKLTTAHHHQTRDECRSCPVVQLCKGSCMFLEGDAFKGACDVSFTYNTAMLATAIYVATGGAVLRRMEGPARDGGVLDMKVIEDGEIAILAGKAKAAA